MELSGVLLVEDPWVLFINLVISRNYLVLRVSLCVNLRVKELNSEAWYIRAGARSAVPVSSDVHIVEITE